MPEGDTIHSVARALTPDLLEKVVLMVELNQVPQAWSPQARVLRCEAVGKHLWLSFEPSDPEAPLHHVRVHLGMNGQWQRYRPGEPWRRSPNRRKVVLQTTDWLFVCFDPMVVELTHAHDFARSRTGHLGPDLLAPDFSASEAVERARLPRHQPLRLGELMLAQTAACGIGNVYKNEGLFILGLSPWQPSLEVSDTTLLTLYERMALLMRENFDHGRLRTTTRGAGALEGVTPPPTRFWVYERGGQPCYKCRTPIQIKLQGQLGRLTWWCDPCQPLR